MMTIRNYVSAEFDRYTEFNAIRLLNMSTGVRYSGVIHEQPKFRGIVSCRALPHTLLHHDGYVMLNNGSDEGKAKLERNLKLLKKTWKRDPNDIRALSQYLDSAIEQPDYQDMLRHAVKLALSNSDKVDRRYSAPLLSTAVEYAYNKGLPELDEWGKKAVQTFPDSYSTKIDTTYILLARAHDLKDYETVIRLGKVYLEACTTLENDPNGWMDLRFRGLKRRGEKWTAIVTSCIAESHYYLGQYETAVSTFEKVAWSALRDTEVRGILVILMSIYSKSDLDLTGLLIRFWDGICEETPNKCIADERKEAFRGVGLRAFFILDDNTHLSWRMFLPLRGKCILGDAAVLLNAETPEEADLILADIDDLTELPPSAFIHALKLGAEFPIPGKTLTTDQIAALAEKLLIDPPFLREAAKFAASAAQTEQEVMWAYALAKVALNQATAELEQNREEVAP